MVLKLKASLVAVLVWLGRQLAFKEPLLVSHPGVKDLTDQLSVRLHWYCGYLLLFMSAERFVVQVLAAIASLGFVGLVVMYKPG